MLAVGQGVTSDLSIIHIFLPYHPASNVKPPKQGVLWSPEGAREPQWFGAQSTIRRKGEAMEGG